MGVRTGVTPCGIRRAMLAADDAWRASLAAVTIGDLGRGMDAQYGPQARTVFSTWLDAPSRSSR